MDALPVPQRIRSATLDEEVQCVTYPSGLRVFLCPKPGFKKRYVCYSVFYGSVDSEFEGLDGRRKVPDGIAHFLEHTLFETEQGNASDFFAQKGAYSNAATSFTTTTYLFAASDRFHENLDMLLRFVENPVFHPDKVEKERGIIEQEIQGYKDNPQWVSYMGLLENLFEKHPVRIDIAGTVESIARIDSATLHDCYRAFYHPANMSVFAVGDIESDRFFAHIAEASRFASAAPLPPSGWKLARLYPVEPSAVFRRETRMRMEVALPKLLLGFKETSVPDHGEEYVRRDLAGSLALEILFGRSSDLFQELYQSGLILDDFGASYSIGAGIAHGVVGGETPDPDRLRDILLGRIESLRRCGIRREDFERSKRMVIGGFIRGFNSLDYIAGNYTHFRFHGFDLFRVIDVLAGLELSLLEERVLALLDPGNHASFVVLPA